MKNSNLLGDKMNIEKINNEIIKFVEERDWEKFHSPKNISMALSVEASELLEIFQWDDNKQLDEKINKKQFKERVSDEVADVLLYLLRFSEIANLDLEKICLKKIRKNAKKYPIKLSKGKSTKYTFLKKI